MKHPDYLSHTAHTMAKRSPHSMAMWLSLLFISLLAVWDIVPMLRDSHHYALSSSARLAVSAIHMMLVFALLWMAYEDEARECAIQRSAVACHATRTAREFFQLQSVTTGVVVCAALYLFLAGGDSPGMTTPRAHYTACWAALLNIAWFAYNHVPVGGTQTQPEYKKGTV